MKKIWIMALVVLLVLPLMADRTWNETFTTAFNLNASATKTHGTDVGLTTDYAGNRVPRGRAPDIGAYEFQRRAKLILW